MCPDSKPPTETIPQTWKHAVPRFPSTVAANLLSRLAYHFYRRLRGRRRGKCQAHRKAT